MTEEDGWLRRLFVINPKVHDLTVFASTDDHDFSEN